MNIGLIGCGRVGVSIFSLLRRKNRIVGIYDINRHKILCAARLLRTGYLDLRELVQQSEALFIATPDDEIVKVYKKIKPFINQEKHVFHFSGILNSDVFGRARKIHGASAHPLATFPAITVKEPLKPYWIFCEGDRRALTALRKMLPTRYFKLLKIHPRNKTMHHLCGVFASNFLIGLYLIAQQCSQKAWSGRVRDELIAGIMDQTLENIREKGVKKALSGPLERGDDKVIKKHLRALKGNPDLDKTYRALSRILLKTMPRGSKYQRIRKLLGTAKFQNT